MTTKYAYQIIAVDETAMLPTVLNSFGELGWCLHHQLPDGGYVLERETSAPEATVVQENHFHDTTAVEAWTEEEIRSALFESERHGRLHPDKVIPQTERYKYSAEVWTHWRGNGLMAALRGEL